MCLTTMRQILLFSAIFTTSVFLSMPAHAWDIPKSISTIEWDAWPRICQGSQIIRGKTSMPRDRTPPRLTKQEHQWSKKFGIWHFCTGYIHLLRAEANPDQRARKRILNKWVFQDLNWVPKGIKPEHPLSPLVNTALARALRSVGQHEKAIEVLDKIRKHHPSDPNLYSVYTAIYFDEKDYPKAIEILEQGNQATGDKIGELQYFLGLAYFYTDQIDKARIYEEKARQNKYPFRALTRKLAEHDAKKASSSAQE